MWVACETKFENDLARAIHGVSINGKQGKKAAKYV